MQIKQNIHFEDYPEIKKYGCYFLSLIFLASKIVGIDFQKAHILSFYNMFIEKGIMRKDCYILQPDKMLKLLTNQSFNFSKVQADVVKTPMPERMYIAMYEYADGWSHFVVYDLQTKTIIYDPFEGSRASKNPDQNLKSFRIFYPVKN